MLIAMQGLFMFYWGSRRALVDYNCGLKFIAIKLVIFVSAIQEFVIDLAVPRSNDGSFYDHEARAQLWSNALLLTESAGLTLLMWHAFPERELTRAHEWRIHGHQDIEAPASASPTAKPVYGGMENGLALDHLTSE